MEELFYTKENYWAVVENDVITIGISNFILDDINIINYTELPQIGTICNKTDLIGVINYNSDENLNLYSQFSGEIIDINDSIIDNSEQLFSNDINNNWLYRIFISSKKELEELMSEEEYKEYLEEI